MTPPFTQRFAQLLVALATLGLCGNAYANFKTLGQRLPASSNAVIAVNVAKLLETPYAKSEDWAKTSAEAWAKQPMMIPPGSTRLLSAAEVRTDSMESYWEMSLIEMEAVPALKDLAAAEGGSIDKVWDKDAVCSPINAYFVALDGKTLASITPANRSAVVKWLRTPATQPQGNVTSDYIQKVLAGLTDKTDIVMAMDLEGAFAIPRIRKFLDDNDIKEIPPAQRDEVARVLGTMQGITFNITVNQDVTGHAVVDFDRVAAPLAQCAKPIMIDVLNAAGMHVDDVEQWTFSTVGKQVIMDGKVSTPTLRKLLGIIQSPVPAATVARQAPAAQGNPSDPAQASQRYYKAICMMLDGFSQGTSASASAQWARNTTKRIEQLPILNVDPELVAWGNNVSLKLKQAGATMAVGQTQINSRTAGVMDPSYGNYYYDNDGVYHSEQAKGELDNAKSQRRQVALEQKAQAQDQALKILSEIAESRPAIRSAMTEKYKVEF